MYMRVSFVRVRARAYIRAYTYAHAYICAYNYVHICAYKCARIYNVHACTQHAACMCACLHYRVHACVTARKVYKYYGFRRLSKKRVMTPGYPRGVQAALSGRDGRIYIFKVGPTCCEVLLLYRRRISAVNIIELSL